ncbi:MAG: hypothetical protein GF411_13905 [Candidatus Lokiarchaeota archaeon]|nr:hypothetical protein [Candidatus Lokiarchaeota archaeon]
MIPKKLFLFWSGHTMSYLRYLTFVTARHFHPDWEINFYVTDDFTTMKWCHEAQDFQNEDRDNYLEQAKTLCDHVRPYKHHEDKAPNFQSDFFRWHVMEEYGGWYLDTDQIILKPFDDLCSYQFVYSFYEANGPVGVLGAEPKLRICNYVRETMNKRYKPSNYNSIGPQMWINVMKEIGKSKWFGDINSLNSKHMFYPVPYSHGVHKIYDGSFEIPKSSYALHWFGGHPKSQKFNNKYTKEFMMASNDTISRFVRTLSL